jgi:hypothetical protein
MSIFDIDKFTLADLPSRENDKFEFKGSKISDSELKRELGKAMSAFANSGGGIFVAGVDDDGNADGGLSKQVGKQDRREWADKIIAGVEPTPQYERDLISDDAGRGTFNADHTALVVTVPASETGPHMAPDGRYYIRAGAHTVRARNFIVEALWARRGFFKPRIGHVVRQKPEHPDILQIGIIALTDAPALNLQVDMFPVPGLIPQQDFPILVPALDRANPLFFDVTTRLEIQKQPDEKFAMSLTYEDLAGNTHKEEKEANVGRAMPSMRFYGSSMHDAVEHLKAIADALSGLKNPPMTQIDFPDFQRGS